MVAKQDSAAAAPADLEEAQRVAETAVSSYLDFVVIVDDVAEATQRQALNALIFAIRVGFGREPGWLSEYRKGHAVKPVPVVLTPGERGDGRWKMEDGRGEMEDGRWKREEGRGEMENGKWKMEDGRWKMEEKGRGLRELLGWGAFRRGRVRLR